MIKKNMESKPNSLAQFDRIILNDVISTVKTKGWNCQCFICRFRSWLR